MSVRLRLLVAGLLVAVAVAGVIVSRRTTPDRIGVAAGVVPPAASAAPTDGSAVGLPVLDRAGAPPVAEAAGWLNSPPLSKADLVGKVVLYDFWTFGCVNCRHTLPTLKAWQARYAGDGLVILSIHTPEFDYEADPANVAEFLQQESITYPVALDPDKAVWRTWDNHYWPAFYLYDDRDRLRLRHIGEGGYDTTEDAIRLLLGVDPASPRA